MNFGCSCGIESMNFKETNQSGPFPLVVVTKKSVTKKFVTKGTMGNTEEPDNLLQDLDVIDG